MPTTPNNLAIDGAKSTLMAPASIALISNPLSYTNRHQGAQSLAEMEAKVTASGGRYWRVNDATSVDSAVQEALSAGCGLIVANGGDGTVHGVVSEVLRQCGDRTAPVIAVLPGGRTNVIAADLGLKGAPKHFITRLIEGWQHQNLNYSERASLQVAQTGQVTRFGFLINGGGLACLIEECWRFRERYRRWGLHGGFGTGCWVVGRILGALLGRRLLQAEEARCYWQSPNGAESLCCNSLAAFSLTTNEKLPLGVSPYADGEQEPASSTDQLNQFKATVISGQARRIAWRIVTSLIRGGAGLNENEGFYSGSARSLRIIAAEPMRFHFDGESYPLATGNELHIQRGPSLCLVQWA